MSLTRKIKNAGLWQTLEIGSLFVAQFLYIGIMARLLSKADFGLMAIAGSFVALGQVFSDGGMGLALIQRKSISDKHKNAALQGGVALGLLVFGIFFFAAPYIASFFDAPSLKNIIRVVGVNVILISASSISLGLLHRNFMFKKAAIISFVAVFFGYSGGVAGAVHGLGVWSLVLATLTMEAIKACGYLLCAPIEFRWKFYKKEWAELFSFGFGIILLKLSNYFGNSGLNLILGKIFTPALLGVFERSNRIKTLPSQHLGTLLDKVLFPAMSTIQNERDRLIEIFKNGIGIANTILIPTTVYLVFFSRQIVEIFLGTKWIDAVLPLQIMFIVLPFSISNRMGDTIIRATGHIYQNVWRKAIYVLFLLAAVSIGATNHGLAGAATAVTVSFIFNYIMTIVLIKRIFNVRTGEVFYKPFIIGLKLGTVMGCLILVFKTLINTYGEMSILQFLSFSIILAGCISFISLTKPSLLGRYFVFFHNKLKSG